MPKRAYSVRPGPAAGIPLKPLLWIGSSLRDMRLQPGAVQDAFGYALHLAQLGESPRISKPLRGPLRGAVELLEDHDGDTYRAVYTTTFAGVIYVLHAFKKKSKRGSATPRRDTALARSRLAAAERHYREWSTPPEQGGR